MYVYKDDNTPVDLKNLSSAGIVSVDYNGRIASESFAELGRRLGLQGPLYFTLNGHALNEAQVATLRIASEAIGQVHTTPASGTPGTVVNIALAAPQPDAQRRATSPVMLR